MILVVGLSDTQKMASKTRAKPTKANDPSSPYRCVESFNALQTTRYDCSTIDQAFMNAVKKYGKLDCLGTRELLSESDEVQPDGKVFKKATFGDYKWLTYDQVNEKVCNLGRGLGALGLGAGEKIGIFLETQAEWMISAQASLKHNFTLVTVYATLGEEGIAYSLNQAEVRFVITSGTLLKTKLEKCLKDIPTLRNIIYWDPDKKVKEVPENVKCVTFDDVIALGSSPEGKEIQTISPKPSDIALIMYTSGTTGNPKGVMITHSNFIAGMTGISMRVPNLTTDDVYIAYLPLAHVLELAAETIFVCSGAKIGYSSPLTLSDRSSRIKPGTSGDATVLKPTLMAAVPEIMERMRKALLQNVSEASYIRQTLFHHAYNYKLGYVEKGEKTPTLDKYIFGKSRALLGGKVRCMLSGGAPLNAKTQRFMNVCMCCPVGQGYGLTETCGAGTVTQVLTDHSTGTVGPPVACCEIKLVTWEEGGYSPTNKPNPQGEVWLGGPAISQGYFKNPEKTAEDYTEEDGQRWFKTGDIGEFMADGSLKIIDRKKDLIKLSHGEYIAVGNIESKLKASTLIDNIWLFASGAYPTSLAFVVPNEKALLALAANKGLTGKSVKELCENSTIEQEIKKALLESAKTAKLQKFEIPQKMVLEPEPWTAESGLTTAAFKLRRKALENHYKDEIARQFPN